mgnify:CR=1 FL=1
MRVEAVDMSEIQRRLDETEHRNLASYGYGAKGFILSMLEAAFCW